MTTSKEDDDTFMLEVHSGDNYLPSLNLQGKKTNKDKALGKKNITGFIEKEDSQGRIQIKCTYVGQAPHYSHTVLKHV